MNEHDRKHQENPYASPRGGAGGEEEQQPVDLVPRAAEPNPYLARLFLYRKYSLLAFWITALFATLRILLTFEPALGSAASLLFTLSTFVLVPVTVGCLIFLFLAAHHHGGNTYAFGHLAVTIFLMPVFYVGIAVVPVLVRGDMERLETGSSDAPTC